MRPAGGTGRITTELTITSTMPESRARIAAAVLCGGIAILLAWAGATGSTLLRVPPAVAYLAACVLALAAVRLLQMVVRPGSSGDGLAALLTGGLAAIGGWIALGSGPRVCGVGAGGEAIGRATGAACRIPFGIGAVIALAMALYAGRRWMRRRARPDS